MKIMERCSCGAFVTADDQPFVLSGNSVDRGRKRYADGSGPGFAADFVERWRDQHVCPGEEPLAAPEAGGALKPA